MASKPGNRARHRSTIVEQRDTSVPGAPSAIQSPQSTGLDWGWYCAAGMLLLAVLAYWPALSGPFIFDDYHLPFSDPNAAKAGAAFWIGGVRPVLMASYWGNFILSGTRTFSYHFVSLLLHAITAGMVFFILRRLLDLANVKTDRRVLALFGAGLFLLHPLQTESVAYVAGRSEVIAGLFLVAAWLVFLNSFGTATKLLTAVEILVLAGAAVAGKESAISLPAILLLTDLYWNPNNFIAQLRSRAKLYVPIVLGGVLAAGKILRSLTSASAAGFATAGVTPARYALTQCRVILTYIRLFLLPVGQNGDWDLPFYRSLTDNAAWVYVLGFGAFIYLIVWSRRRARLLSFGLLVFLVLLLPTSSVVPIKDAIAERRVYVPVIGLILALLWAVDYFRPRLPFLQRTASLRTAFAVVLLAATALTLERSAVWSDDALLWGDSAEKNPSNSRAHMGLGDAYMLHGRCADAIREFKIVEQQDGPGTEMATNLASAYQCNRQPELALNELRTVAAKIPSAAVYDRIGYIEATQGRVSPALDAFENALRLDANDATAYSYRGMAKIALKDSTGAQADLRRALELEPANETALKGLATLAAQQH